MINGELTLTELNHLRSSPQGTMLYLAGVESPPVVFACRVNQTFTTHDMVAQVTYDTVTSGSYANVLAGMTVWVGTSAGAYDIGMCRVRKSPTSSILYIGEGSEIDWQNNLYLTVVDEMGIWARHVRIDNKVVKMDYDTAYDTVTAKQHEKFAPIPIMGANVVLDVQSYPATVTFPNASKSSVFDSTISTWAWSSSAGTWSGATTSNPTLTLASYPANGLVRVALTLTSAAGASFTAYRYIRVYDSTHPPFSAFTLNDLSGRYDDGGFSFSLTMQADAARSLIRDRAPITLFARDYYNNTRVSIGQEAGRENIVCAGWVDGESISMDAEQGTVSFTVQGAHFWLGKITGFPSGLELAKATPAAWTSMPKLNVDRALWHLLHWRSTLTAVCDVYLTGNTLYAAALKSVSATLWEQIKEIAFKSIFAAPGCDPLGRLFVEKNAQLTPEANRANIPVTMTVEKSDWTGMMDIQRRTTPELAMLSLSGVAVKSTGGSSAFFSLANGHIFKRHGRVETIEKMLLSNQAQSNTLAGLYMGWKNNEYPAIRFDLAANNRAITLFPRQYLEINIAPEDNLRGISYNGKLIPRGVTYQYDAAKGVLYPSLECEAETFEDLNTNGDIPPSSGGGYTPPTLPPIPPVPPVPPVIPPYLPPSAGNENHPTTVLIATSNYGILYSENFDETAPEWIDWNDGLSEDEYNEVHKVLKDPNGGFYCLCKRGANGYYERVYYAPTLGEMWELILEKDDTNDIGNFVGMGIDQITGKVAIIGGRGQSFSFPSYMGSFLLGDYNGFTKTDVVDRSGKTTDYLFGVSWSQNGWFVTGQRYNGILPDDMALWKYSLAGTREDLGGAGMGKSASLEIGNAYAESLGALNKSVLWSPQFTNQDFSFVDGDSSYSITALGNPPSLSGRQALSSSPLGLRFMASHQGVYTPYRSSDAGATWESLSLYLPTGLSCWDNCGDDFRWLAGGGTNMKFIPNFGDPDSTGTRGYNKEGNLSYIAPLVNIVWILHIA